VLVGECIDSGAYMVGWHQLLPTELLMVGWRVSMLASIGDAMAIATVHCNDACNEERWCSS